VTIIAGILGAAALVSAFGCLGACAWSTTHDFPMRAERLGMQFFAAFVWSAFPLLALLLLSHTGLYRV
jgi:hypothetical protein